MIVLSKAQRPSTVRLRATSQSSGPPGPSNVITVGAVTTLEPGSPATSALLGSSPAQTWNLGVPRGFTGAAAAPGSSLFETRAAVAAATIPSAASGGPGYVRTAGYAATGDRGGALYKRYTGTPTNSTNPGNVQSLDGQWWRLVLEGPLPIECFGAKGDYYLFDETNVASTPSTNPSPTDNWQAIKYAYEFAMVHTLSSGHDNVGPIVQVGYGYFYVAQQIVFDRSIRFEGLGRGTSDRDSASGLIFPAGVAGILCRSSTATTFWSSSAIRHLVIRSLGNGGQTDKHGIDMKSACSIEHVTVDKFGGNGININCDINVQSNANTFFLNKVCVGENALNGIYCVGGDANAGIGIAIDAKFNGVSGTGFGVRDDSFLANAWIGCHTAGNPSGGYRGGGGNAPVVFIGCYAENDQGPSYAGDKVTFIGGLQGPGVDVSAGGIWQRGKEMIGGTKSFFPGAGAFFKTAKAANTAYSFDYNDGQPFDWKHFGNYWGLQWANQTVSHGIVSNENTGLSFGKPGPINSATVKPGILWTADGGFAPSLIDKSVGRIMGYSDASPPNGAHGPGEYILNALGGSLMGYWNRSQGFTGGTWVSGASLFAPEFKKASNGRWYLMDNTNGVTTVEPTHTSGAVTGADGLQWTHLGTGDAEWVKVSGLVFEVASTVDLPSIAAGASGSASTQTVTVTGAQLGDFAEVSYQGDCQGMEFIAWVSAANQAKWYPVNHTAAAIDLNGTFRVRVRPRVT